MLERIEARLARTETAGPSGAYVSLVNDLEATTLEVGKDCARLTAKYAKYGVTCHALPGIRTPMEGATFMIVGTTESKVNKALDQYAKENPGVTGMKVKFIPF